MRMWFSNQRWSRWNNWKMFGGGVGAGGGTSECKIAGTNLGGFLWFSCLFCMWLCWRNFGIKHLNIEGSVYAKCWLFIDEKENCKGGQCLHWQLSLLSQYQKNHVITRIVVLEWGWSNAFDSLSKLVLQKTLHAFQCKQFWTIYLRSLMTREWLVPLSRPHPTQGWEFDFLFLTLETHFMIGWTQACVN